MTKLSITLSNMMILSELADVAVADDEIKILVQLIQMR